VDVIRQLSSLLDQLEDVYQKSEIRSVAAAAEGHEWAYSLIAGACQPGAPLVIGFNWGANEHTDYEPQTTIDRTPWQTGDRGSLIRILPYVSRYFPDIRLDEISQTNYCFFRSKKESQIRPGDLELCQPVFDELLRIMQPSVMLCFSSRLRDYLIADRRIHDDKDKRIPIPSTKRKITYTALRGSLGRGIPIAFLPHPNYPIPRAAREAAWRFCSTLH